MYCKYLLYAYIYIYIFIRFYWVTGKDLGSQKHFVKKHPENSVFHVCRGDPMVLKVEFQMLFELVTWQHPRRISSGLRC